MEGAGVNHWAHLYPDWFKAEAGDIANRLRKNGRALAEETLATVERAIERPRLRDIVLKVLATVPASSLDVAASTGLSVKTASAVLCDLRLDGLIEKCGTDRLEDSGKTVIVYTKVEDTAKCAASA